MVIAIINAFFFVLKQNPSNVRLMQWDNLDFVVGESLS